MSQREVLLSHRNTMKITIIELGVIKVDAILNKDEKKEVEEIIDFLKTLGTEEQQKINIFIQGIKFAKQTVKNTA